MKYTLTSTYSAIDTVGTSNEKTLHVIRESWADLDDTSLVNALNEILDIKITNGEAEMPTIENVTKMFNSCGCNSTDAIDREFNRQMSGYHAFNRIMNDLDNVKKGINHDTSIVVRLVDCNTTIEIMMH